MPPKFTITFHPEWRQLVLESPSLDKMMAVVFNEDDEITDELMKTGLKSILHLLKRELSRKTSENAS